ncbi:MAG: cytochrome P450, partial [Candidatus Binataceae bacterium]
MDTTPGVYFNPWDPVFRADPYPHYKALLAGPPRTFDMVAPMALVARYADVVAVLHDHERFSSVRPRVPAFRQGEARLFREGETVLFSDPPTHTRLRRLVSRAFTPKRIRDLEPRIREITGHLLDRAAARGELEVVGDLATPLPVMVIAEMLGVPSADYVKFKRWSDLIIERNATPPGEPISEESTLAAIGLRAYFAEEIAARRRRPGEDLVSVLVAAHDEAEALSEDELLAFVILLLIAGNETTTNLIGNGTLALARHPAQLDLLRGERALMAPAVEEMLRYDPPVQTVVRRPTADVEIGGTALKAETLTFVILA